jgi:TP901 family phage tail tape measure protein
MADTEKAVVNTEIKVDSKEAMKSLNEIESKVKQVEKVKKKAAEQGIISDTDIKNVRLFSKEIQAAFANFQKANPNLLNKSMGEAVGNISSQMKSLNKQLKALQAFYTGLPALIKKAEVSGKRANLQYGGVDSNTYQAALMANLENKINKTIKSYQLAQAGVSEETQKYAERSQQLNQYLGVTQLRLMANYAAINTVTNGLRSVLNYTGQFNEELKQLQAISAVSDTGLEGLKETIYEVANATKFTSLEVAQSATVLAQAGLSVSQIKETLPAIAKLATATGTDLATSTDVITSTLNIYSLQVTEATQVTNALTTAMNESKADIAGFQTAIQYAGNFAAQLGMSYEETAAAIAAATQAGIRSKSMLGTGLRAVLTEFLKPTDKLVAQLAKVGLTVSDIDVRSKGLTTVLKTLKEAGFGAAEAFRGMERRGAAFLVALVNQVDFIGQLREKMAGSTAAAEANEIQMEALTNQWKNFKSILGNVAYDGLEPIIELLSKLLKTINSFMSSGLVGVLGSVLFGTVTAAATTGFVSLIIKSLGTITSSVLKLGKSLEVISRYSQMKGVSSAVVGISAIFTKLPLGQVTMFATAIAALVTTLGMAASAMGLFTSEADKAKAKLEESLGNLDKAQQGYNTLQNMLDRFYANRQKLDDQSERNIFVREILTRVPEANKVITDVTLSVNDLEKALLELNNIRLDRLVKETKKVAEAARLNLAAQSKEIVRNFIGDQAGSLVSQKDIDRVNASLIRLAGATGRNFDISKISSLSTQLLSTGVQRQGGRIVDYNRYSEKMSEALIKELRTAAEKTYPNDPSAQADFLRNVDRLLEDTDVLKGLASDVADDIEAQTNAINAAATQGFKLQFGDEVSQKMNVIQEAIADSNRVQEDINNLIQLGTSLQKEDTQAIKDSTTRLEELQKDLDSLKNVKTTADLANFFGIDEKALKSTFNTIRNRNPELKGVTDEEMVSIAVKNLTTEFSGASSRLIEAITSWENTIESHFPEIKPRNAATETSRLISQRIGSLRSVPVTDLEKEKGDIQKLIEEYKTYARATAGLSNLEEGVSLTPEQERAEARISMQVNAWSNKISEASTKVASTIDLTSYKMNDFFKLLKANIEEADAAYNRAIANMNKPLDIQQGIVSGAERYYGSGSVIATAEQNRLSEMQEATLEEETRISQQLYNRYEEILKQLRSNSLYSNIKSEYNKASAAYESAKASGNAVAIEAAYKNLNQVSDTYYKFAKQEADLEKSTDNLKSTVDKNNATLEYIKNQRELSGFEAIGKGANDAFYNYRKDVENQGLTSLTETTAKFTAQSIDTLDSSMSEMFSNILSGSAKAGDAFKSFGQTVIATLRDIAVQMAVKQGLNLLFSYMDWGDVSGPTNLLAQIPGFGKATGGLITGPVKNRDSVVTKLMPGEYVLKKSAVDTIGRDYLDNLNNNADGIIQESKQDIDSSMVTSSTDSNSPSPSGVVNVYVVAQDQQQGLSPSDVVVTISQDILKGGQTKKLIKQVAMGGI